MKLLRRTILILAFPLLIIGGTNYCFDPDYTLRRNYIRPFVDALLEGKMISGPVNVNSRTLKKEWISRLPELPDVVVLGSSRTLALSQEAIPGQRFFNASVTNCTFQDMYAFLNVFETKWANLPPTIIICADQWLFGNAFDEKQWLVNRPDFERMARKAGVNPDLKIQSKWELDKEWLKELFSAKYLIRSLKACGKTEPFEIVQSVRPDKMMFLPDGSRHLPIPVTNIPSTELSVKATDYFYSSRDEHFTDLDKTQQHLFRQLIGYLENHGCKIIVFIPPYHPETYRLLEQSPQTSGILQVEPYLRTFENDRLLVIGGTNPGPQDLTANDFYDAVHLKQNIVNQIVKRLFSEK